ncbi:MULTISPECIES: YjfB family protein [Cohnella]|uniref:YjfB family protein n=1 Tax=Cohnella TaxID=329857 RepID=UPI0009BBCA38|nr:MULTISPECIES: YjfB family protein [Cohnella]MBN2983920.1 YjfB family protein [Cohnella algarum]
MDVGALSISLSQSALKQSVGIQVLAMAKNQAEIQGQMFVQMASQSLDPNLGGKLDIKV